MIKELYEQKKDKLISSGIPSEYITMLSFTIEDIFNAHKVYEYEWDYFESAFSSFPPYQYSLSYDFLGFDNLDIYLIVWLENNE